MVNVSIASARSDLHPLGRGLLTAGAARLDAVQQRAGAGNLSITAVGVPELRQRHLLCDGMVRRHRNSGLIHVGDTEDLLHRLDWMIFWWNISGSPR